MGAEESVKKLQEFLKSDPELEKEDERFTKWLVQHNRERVEQLQLEEIVAELEVWGGQEPEPPVVQKKQPYKFICVS